MGISDLVRQIVCLLPNEAFHFRGAKIRNRTGKPVRLEVQMEAYEIRKIRQEQQPANEDDMRRRSQQ